MGGEKEIYLAISENNQLFLLHIFHEKKRAEREVEMIRLIQKRTQMSLPLVNYFITHDDEFVLVFGFKEGLISFDQYQKQHLIIEPRIFAKMNQIIQELHQASFVHLGLNSYCWVIDPKSLEIYLIDFGSLQSKMFHDLTFEKFEQYKCKDKEDLEKNL
jgi:serine/threonine protein kinase